MTTNTTDATPAQVDLFAEQLVLGQILDWPEAFALYDAAGLSTLDFFRTAHAWIWDAASDVAADGLEVGQPNVSLRLRELRRWDEVGAAYFGSLTEGVPRPDGASLAAWVQRLHDLSAARRASKMADDFLRACERLPAGLDAETLAGHVARLDTVRGTVTDGTRGDMDGQLSALGEVLTRPPSRRVHLGLPSLDDLLGGIDAGDVCGILARTSVGKSILACHIARTAASAGLGQVFVSLEMPMGAVVARLARAAFGFSRHQLGWRWCDGTFDQGAYRATFASLQLVDTPGLALDRIEQIVRTHQRRQDVSLVLIDYLGLIGGSPSLSTYDRISQIATGLKGLAKRCETAVVVLIQANRAGGQDGSERLSLTAARDAGVVEEALDVLVGMRRVDHSPKLTEDVRQRYQDVIWAEVLKHRHGPTSARETAIRVDPISLALREDPDLTLDEQTARMVRRATGAI